MRPAKTFFLYSAAHEKIFVKKWPATYIKLPTHVLKGESSLAETLQIKIKKSYNQLLKQIQSIFKITSKQQKVSAKAKRQATLKYILLKQSSSI